MRLARKVLDNPSFEQQLRCFVTSPSPTIGRPTESRAFSRRSFSRSFISRSVDHHRGAVHAPFVHSVRFIT